MKRVMVVLFVMELSLLVASCASGDLKFFSESRTKPIESMQLATPLIRISAEDNSFTLTTSRFDGSPFYSNDEGPQIAKRLRAAGGKNYAGKTRAVRVTVEGYDEDLYGRLAIFPALNPGKYGRADLFLPERFNLRITVSPETLAQMEKEGVGFSCAPYHQTLHDWCDWVLWISRSPITE